MNVDIIPGFCKFCACVLPIVDSKGKVVCPLCKTNYGLEAYGTMEASYTIHFNSRDKYSDSSTRNNEDDADGPVVDRKCPKCNNDKMSYATLQLRSADEGQTVFYTCTKCKFKESENS